MTIWELSVSRPVMTSMIIFIILIFGAVSFLRLPIDLMPDITFPVITVSASYSNTGPEEMEELVTRRLEEALVAVTGVEEISSSSREGSSQVRVSFTWGTDLSEATNDIRDRVDRIIGRLPDDVDRPTIRKFDMSSMPVLMLGAKSNLDPVLMRKIIDEQIKYRIERIPGVASLDVMGGREREIHVELDPGKVKALDLALDSIVNSVKAGNIETPAGKIKRGRMDVAVRTRSTFTSVRDIENIVVATIEGTPVTLGEIARVEDSWKEETRKVRVDGENGLQLSVSKQSGENTVQVAKGVLKELEAVNRDIPQINIVPIVDSSEFIQKSVDNVTTSALYGGAFAILILLFFLRNIRSTLVVAAAIPVSIIATFSLIYFADFTLNIMTLGGLALGVGMLVDNSIVVLENIYRKRELGNGAIESALSGSEEVAAAIVASTLTTIVVFLPMLFMKGMAGELFKQLAFVIGFSLFCSLMVALTIVPMLSSKILKDQVQYKTGNKPLSQRISERLENLFINVENGYRHYIAIVLNNRWKTLGFTFLVLLMTISLFPLVGTELMPTSDEGEIRINSEMEPGVTLDIMDEKARMMEGILVENVPEIKRFVTMVGGNPWGGAGSNKGTIRLSLKSLAERKRSSDEIANDLRRRLANIPGVLNRIRAGGGMMMRGSGGGDRLQLEIRGYDMQVANELGMKVKALVEKVDGVTDAQMSRERGNPEEIIRMDREKIADLGLTISGVGNTLRTALSGTTAAYYREGGDEYVIRVRLEDPDKMSLEDVLDITVRNSRGESIALKNVISVVQGEGPPEISRKDQERLITVSAEIADRDLGAIVEDVREQLKSIPIPRGFQIIFGGDYEEQRKAFRDLFYSLVLSLILVYMVMAGLYESFLDPLIVMFSVPLAAIGVILMLFMTDTTLNIQSFIGVIMLGGIVVNNAILIVDYTNLLRSRDNYPVDEAIKEAGRCRLRPILMTTLTTMLGLLPLAIGFGEGSEQQAPMARAVIGGLLSSSLISLFIVPAVYSLFHRKEKSMKTSAVITILITFSLFAAFGVNSVNASSPASEEANAFVERIRGIASQLGTENNQINEQNNVSSVSRTTDKIKVDSRINNENSSENSSNTVVSLPLFHEQNSVDFKVDSHKGQGLVLGLDDAVMMALSNNPSIAVERIKAQSASLGLEEAKAAFDLQLDGGLTQSNIRTVRVTDTTTKGLSANMGLSKKMESGASLSFDLSGNRSKTDPTPANSTAKAGLRLNMPLMRGSDARVNRASITLAQIAIESSVYELQAYTESFVSDVEKAYWDLVLVGKQVTIYQESLRIAEEQMNITSERIKYGSLAETEMAAAKAEVASRKEALINAKSNFSSAKLRFIRLMNPENNSWDMPIELIDDPAPCIDDDCILLAIDEHVQLALNNRSDLLQARLGLERGDIEILRTRNGILPKMDFFINLGKTGYAESFSKAFQDLDGKSSDFSFGLSFQESPNRRSAKAAHNRAKLSKEQQLLSLQNLEMLVQVDVRTAYLEVLRSKEQIIATAATRAVREESFRAETEKFSVGKTTSFLVAQAQRDLVSARISEVQSIINHLKAVINLAKADGTFLEKRGYAVNL